MSGDDVAGKPALGLWKCLAGVRYACAASSWLFVSLLVFTL